MNETFLIGSLFDCRFLDNSSDEIKYNSFFKQTAFGCHIISLLQDMLFFKVQYVIENEKDYLSLETELISYNNKSVDIIARPVSLRDDVLDLAHPLHSMLNWNFGFTIYRPEVLSSVHNFYSKPFNAGLWMSLNAMAIFCSVLFYLFKLCEIRLVPGEHWEPSFGYEVLMVIGAYCQHIPPIGAVLYSKRGAYFVFFVFAYLIYTYYASNLLSHIVNDKDDDIDANEILDSDLECVILEDVKWIIWNNIANINGNTSATLNKLFHLKSVSILEGLKAVKSENFALLSDYITIEPFIRSVFESHEICSLTNIDIGTKIEKYFVVSNDFPYKEEFKAGIMRIHESGILSRMVKYYDRSYAECVPLHIQTHFYQILSPLCILLGTYLLSVIILLGETVYYRRNRLWPYVP